MADPYWNSVRALLEFDSNSATVQEPPAFADGPIASDPYSSNTKLLLLGEEAAGATTIVDQTGKTITRASIVNTPGKVPKLFSNKSTYWYWSSGWHCYTADSEDWNFGSGDFTIEMWAYHQGAFPGGGTYRALMSQRTSGISNHNFTFCCDPNGYLYFELSSTGGTGSGPVATTPLQGDTWYHVAAVRSGNELILFIDGKIAARSNFSGSSYNSTSVLAIGATDGGTANRWVGSLDRIRVTKGVARYTSDFSSSIVKSYITMSDQRWGYSIPIDSAVRFDLTNYKIGTSSLQFDGQTFLKLPRPPIGANHPFNWTLSGDFTIEMWLRTESNLETYPALLSSGTVSSWTTDSSALWVDSWSEKGIVRWAQYGDFDIYSRTPLNPGTWMHIALVKENGVANLFVNGYLEASSTFTDSLYLGSTSGYETYLGGNSWDLENSYFKGNLDAFRITEEVRYYLPAPQTACYTVPTVANPDATNADANWNNVVFLQKFNYTDGPYSGISEQLHKINWRHGAKIVNTDYKFSTGSLYMSAASGTPEGAWTSANSKDLALAAGDFTIEMWIKLDGTTASRYLLRNRQWTTNAWTLEWNPASQVNKFAFFVYNHNTGVAVVASDVFTTTNAWIHLAITRASNNFKIFINGTQSGATGVSSANVDNSISSGLIFGTTGTSATSTSNFAGWLDSLRITKGVARYTANFTAPTEAFPSPVSTDDLYSAVVASLHMDGANNSTTFTDSRGLLTWTASGTAKISTAQSRFGGSSAYFDGTTTAYVVSSINQYANLYNSSFTGEAWIYLDPTFSTNGTIFAVYDGTAASYWGSNVKVVFKVESTRQLVFGLPLSNNSSYYMSGVAILPLSTWIHVAASYDVATKRAAIFIDGKLDRTMYVNVNMYEDEPCRITIGRLDPLDTATRWPFKGYIDDFRFTKTQQQSPRYNIPRCFVPSEEPFDKVANTTNDLELRLPEVSADSTYENTPQINPQQLVKNYSFARDDRNTRFYKKGNLNYLFEDIYSNRSANKKISGHVYYSHTPSQKRVYVYDKNTRQLIADAWSDPVTGYYEFYVEGDLKYFILAFDESGNANIVAEDDISPV